VRLTRGVHLVGSGEIGLSDPWDAHVYLLDGGSELALVDAGCGQRDSVDRMLANVREDGLDTARITTLLLTHWHPDHSGGAATLRERLAPRLRVHAPAAEQATIEGALQPGLNACAVDVPLVHAQEVQVGSLRVRAIEVPGHSSGSMCYLVHVPDGGALFSGDVVFMNGILGLLNHPDSHLDQYRTSFERLVSLEVEMLFPGHMLFFLRGARRHIDRAAQALQSGFVPYSVGQLGIDFLPPHRM
jgi:glyoxylase-like metal-dependent hydrolase (beta-lactamase superfamily II)